MIKDFIYSKCSFLFAEKAKTFGFYFLILLLCMAMTVKSTNYDFDLWARLIAGMAVVQTGQLLKYDFLSYTPTHEWYDHEWGSSVVFYLFQNYFGTTGLLLLQILLFFGVMFLLIKTVKLKYGERCDYKNLLIYFVVLNAFCVTYHSLVRCQSFSFLFFMFELYILELIRKSSNYKLLCIFPFLFLIWGNMHGGFASGLGLLILYTIGEAINKKTFKYYLITSCICPLMLFVNPYGIGYIKFLFDAITMPRPHVVEWFNIFSQYNYHLFLQFKFLALFYLIIEGLKVKNNGFKWQTVDKTKFLVLAITLAMAIKHVKLMPFFVLTGTLFCYEDVINSFKQFKFPNWCTPVLTVFLTLFSVYLISAKNYNALLDYRVYPVMEVEFIKINKLKGKLLTNFGIGSYASYKLYPQNKIYMDGRYEEVYEHSLLSDMSDLFLMRSTKLLVENKPDIIILEKDYKNLYKYLKSDTNWYLAFDGLIYGVFIDKKLKKSNFVPPSGDMKYYKKTLFNTDIKFKGENSLDINKINKRGL